MTIVSFVGSIVSRIHTATYSIGNRIYEGDRRKESQKTQRTSTGPFLRIFEFFAATKPLDRGIDLSDFQALPLLLAEMARLQTTTPAS